MQKKKGKKETKKYLKHTPFFPNSVKMFYDFAVAHIRTDTNVVALKERAKRTAFQIVDFIENEKKKKRKKKNIHMEDEDDDVSEENEEEEREDIHQQQDDDDEHYDDEEEEEEEEEEEDDENGEEMETEDSMILQHDAQEMIEMSD